MRHDGYWPGSQKLRSRLHNKQNRPQIRRILASNSLYHVPPQPQLRRSLRPENRHERHRHNSQTLRRNRPIALLFSINSFETINKRGSSEKSKVSPVTYLFNLRFATSPHSFAVEISTPRLSARPSDPLSV